MKSFSYEGAKTREISFPLGGIGSGSIGLSGTGHLVDWEIFNRPSKGSRNGFTHFAVKAEAGGKLLDARALHGDVHTPYAGTGPGKFSGFGFGVARETLSGLPHFKETIFHGSFPFGRVEFIDPTFPGKVSLTAFNPMIPLNDKDSSLPAAFFTVDITNNLKKTIDYTVAFSVCNPAKDKTTNIFSESPNMSLLHFTGDLESIDVKFGNFAVATDSPNVSAQEYWYRGGWFDSLGVFWQDFTKPGDIKPRSYPVSSGGSDHGTLAVRIKAPRGKTATARFVFSWNVPNCENYWTHYPEKSDNDEKEAKPRGWKNYYATIFPDATESAKYCFENWERLESESKLFSNALLSSTLPHPVLDAVSANISVLKTATCLRLEDGSFYGWEGCHSNEGSCEGSCTHVWNYTYALPFLFPKLERSMRELDYKYKLRPDGGMPFRLQLPAGAKWSGFRPCADGQFGGVIKVYREWKISGNNDWLRNIWPGVRKSLEFAWSPDNIDCWDPDRTGVLQGRQHHTLDMELFGPNAWLTGFYLAALKAGAEMAEACGENENAEEYRIIFNKGQKWVTENLFNGEYFAHAIDPGDKKVLSQFKQDPNVKQIYWSDEHSELKYQIGNGCGIDQVLAQWHADLVGLGDIFDKHQTEKALKAIYRHNYKSSMRDVFNPCRLYCVNNEAGTMMFTWPKGRRKPVIPIPYAEETMHGFEYQAACHLIMRGMIDEGVQMVKAVRDRYDGERRNPWNEIECGSNYARSMASYALLNAFSGFEFDMVKKHIGFSPLPYKGKVFRSFWSLNSAWGSFEQRAGSITFRVLYGNLELESFAMNLGKNISITLKGRHILFEFSKGVIRFSEPVSIRAGEAIRITDKSKCL